MPVQVEEKENHPRIQISNIVTLPHALPPPSEASSVVEEKVSGKTGGLESLIFGRDEI